MKKAVLLLIVAAPACAQFVVTDPGNTAVNAAVQAGQAANHLAVMREWAEQAERLNRQLRQLEDQLSVQRRIREVMGDPSLAGAGIVLTNFGTEDLARSYGETLAAARRLADALDSLRRTSEGIYRQLEDRTVLGGSFVRREALYRRYAAVERQADNLATVTEETDGRTAAIQADVAATLESLRAASTQAEVDKLSAKLAVLNGQLGQMATRRRDEADKLQAQQILNENQAAKERQDFLENQLAEERQSLAVAASWQEAMKLKPTDYSR